ncbi:MAG: M23 family metallopeptidase, partial [Hyphomicrobium sp.]
MLDRRRHAPLARPRLARLNAGARGLPQVYGGRGRRTLSSIYDADHADDRHGGRFRWMLSTCLAGMVGAVAIGIVIFGSLDAREAGIDVPSVLSRIREAPFGTASSTPQRDGDGPRWAVPRSDRMQPAAGAPTVRQLIHEQIQVRRNGRPYNQIRPYVRIVARLQPVSPRNFDVIPPFNPIALYGAQGSDRDGAAASGPRSDFKFQVLEQPLGSAIVGEDDLEIDTLEAAEIVAQFEAEEILVRAQTQSGPAGGQNAYGRGLTAEAAQNTTVLSRKRAQAVSAAPENDGHVQQVHTLQRGQSLQNVLIQTFHGERIQVVNMLAAMRRVLADAQVTPGLQMHVTMVPSLTRPGKEPARFSLFTEAGEHKVSVTRNAAGEFEASDKPFMSAIVRAAMQENDATPQGSSIYFALYNAALMMGVPSATITQKLRVHAYDTDFRRAISPGDFAEFFFDIREETAGENAYGDLLFTAMSTGGDAYRYWRFRTPDNQIDYFDESGNNSKKFLLRRPVRGENVRLASGFGVRLHPILRFARPHNGIDWAAPPGTPILAAGNGVIEEAKYKGEFGNFIKIQHSNGYHSQYAHMSRYAPRIQEGVRVRQGEVIGYVGNTGLSAGPHLHFEIHVAPRPDAPLRPVDPLSIQVPRERQLNGKQLADFQKDRARIDELMRRAPVMQ